MLTVILIDYHSISNHNHGRLKLINYDQFRVFFSASNVM